MHDVSNAVQYIEYSCQIESKLCIPKLSKEYSIIASTLSLHESQDHFLDVVNAPFHESIMSKSNTEHTAYNHQLINAAMYRGCSGYNSYQLLPLLKGSYGPNLRKYQCLMCIVNCSGLATSHHLGLQKAWLISPTLSCSSAVNQQDHYQ